LIEGEKKLVGPVERYKKVMRLNLLLDFPQNVALRYHSKDKDIHSKVWDGGCRAKVKSHDDYIIIHMCTTPKRF
jgi:hypothetical protein